MTRAGTTTTSSVRRTYKQPLKRRLTVYFQDEKVQRFENQGVPTQADLGQLERDLQKAIADTKKKQPKHKQRIWRADRNCHGCAAARAY